MSRFGIVLMLLGAALAAAAAAHVPSHGPLGSAVAVAVAAGIALVVAGAGALWRARVWAADEDAALQRGEPIVVEREDRLMLTVRRAEEWEVAR